MKISRSLKVAAVAAMVVPTLGAIASPASAAPMNIMQQYFTPQGTQSSMPYTASYTFHNGKMTYTPPPNATAAPLPADPGGMQAITAGNSQSFKAGQERYAVEHGALVPQPPMNYAARTHSTRPAMRNFGPPDEDGPDSIKGA
jgi:hypothetical protein